MTENLFNEALKWTETKGFSDIKANFGEFERPTTYSKSKEDKPYVPDITAFRRGSKCYIEIATKDEDQNRSISKWKLLSSLANLKGGKLFLLVPRGHKAFVERINKQYRLDANVVYMPKL